MIQCRWTRGQQQCSSYRSGGDLTHLFSLPCASQAGALRGTDSTPAIWVEPFETVKSPAIAQKCKNMAVNRLGVGHLFIIWELKQEHPATSLVSSTKNITCTVSNKMSRHFHVFPLTFLRDFLILYFDLLVFMFLWCSLSFLDLWSYSFYHFWRVFAIFSYNIFVSSVLKPFGSLVTHILVPSSQWSVSLCFLTGVSFEIFFLIVMPLISLMASSKCLLWC